MVDGGKMNDLVWVLLLSDDNFVFQRLQYGGGGSTHVDYDSINPRLFPNPLVWT
jgi:hypothetical protein